MLYNHDSNTLIYTPPKTGSSMLHHVLCPRGWIYVMGPQVDGLIETHTMDVPWRFTVEPDAVSYFICRDPVDRALSLYSHWKQWWKRPNGTFDEFTREVVGGIEFFTFDLVWYYKCTGQTPRIIKLEEIHNLPFLPPDLPIVNKGSHGGRLSLRKSELEFIERWFHRDYKFFKYATPT